MEKSEQQAEAEEPGRERFRQLPPRVTPDEMVPVQPVAQARQDPREGLSETEWAARMGWTG
jgi:hypothetical protein